MEHNTKRLYIFTIAAILLLLAVQTLWLYNQYSMTINNERSRLLECLNSAITDYGYIRFSTSDTSDSLITSYTKSSLSYRKNDMMDQGYIEIKINHEARRIRDLLKISDNRPITKEDKDKASHIMSTLPFDSLRNPVKSFRLPTSMDAAKLYEAMSDASTELRSPFTLIGIDSILRKKDITVTTSLVKSDTLLWKPSVNTSLNPAKPEINILYPYSTLDHKCIQVSYRIPLSNILRNMGLILILCFVLSVLLIICLVCQIRMILVYAHLDSVRNSFVHTMIHELKRPLSTLKICVSALSNRKMMASEDTRISILEKCRGAVNNLSTYFSRLRDITFNEASQIPLGIESCNIRRLIYDVIEYTDIPSSKKVDFIIECDDAIQIACDPLHMSQMLGNLIENAIKYSGDKVNIIIKVNKDHDSVAISVEDDGIGISETDMSRIFNKFYRSDSAMRSGAPGVGLGLAYVSLLAEAHGGCVSVKSEPEKGSCFTIKIPQ